MTHDLFQLLRGRQRVSLSYSRPLKGRSEKRALKAKETLVTGRYAPPYCDRPKYLWWVCGWYIPSKLAFKNFTADGEKLAVVDCWFLSMKPYYSVLLTLAPRAAGRMFASRVRNIVPRVYIQLRVAKPTSGLLESTRYSGLLKIAKSRSSVGGIASLEVNLYLILLQSWTFYNVLNKRIQNSFVSQLMRSDRVLKNWRSEFLAKLNVESFSKV